MPNRSALHGAHEARGARFVDFGGWEMPVQYESVLAEHATVRESCGWFDVSHLGRCVLAGSAVDAIDFVFSNDIRSLEPYRTQYTFALNASAGIIDDVIVWRRADDFVVLPNAGNHHRVMDLLREAGGEPEDWRPRTSTIAVQGPAAPDVMERVLGVRPRRSRVEEARFGDSEVLVGGSGYTGEAGGEIVVDNESAAAVLDALEQAGAKPCGLGARDTLRLEAGLPLWGQDIDESTTPVEAGLDFAVSYAHEFRGREALLADVDRPPAKRLVAFRTEGRLIPRHGYRLRAGAADGEVTSGNFSPTLQYGIGLGYVSSPEPHDLELEVRGTWHPVEIVQLPFYRRR